MIARHGVSLLPSALALFVPMLAAAVPVPPQRPEPWPPPPPAPAQSAPAIPPSPGATPAPEPHGGAYTIAAATLGRAMSQLLGGIDLAPVDAGESLLAARAFLRQSHPPDDLLAMAVWLIPQDQWSLLDSRDLFDVLYAAGPDAMPATTAAVLSRAVFMTRAMVTHRSRGREEDANKLELLRRAGRRDPRVLEVLRDCAVRENQADWYERIDAIQLLDALSRGADALPLPAGTIEVWEDAMLFDFSDVQDRAIDALIHHCKGMTEQDRPWLKSMATMDVWRFIGMADHPLAQRRLNLALDDPRYAFQVLTAYKLAGPRSDSLAPEVARHVLQWARDRVGLNNPELIRQAISALIARGPRAKAGADSIAELLRDPRWRERATSTLQAIGPAAMPSLALLYTNCWNDLDVRLTVIGIAGNSDVACPLSRSLLAAATLADTSPRVQAAAADAWAAVAEPQDVPVDALTARLAAAADPAVRESTARLLAAAGPRAAAAIPALLRMADNVHAPSRHAAARALVKIVAEPRRLAPAVLAAVRHRDRAMRDILLPSIRDAGDPALVSRLKEMAEQEPDAAVQAEARSAAEALARKWAQTVLGL